MDSADGVFPPHPCSFTLPACVSPFISPHGTRQQLKKNLLVDYVSHPTNLSLMTAFKFCLF